MSLRKIAKELGVSHTLLVLWRQGKRSLPPEMEARYHELVALGGEGATEGVTSVTTLAPPGGDLSTESAPQGIKSPVLCLAELTALRG
jgi:hypothetical protein